MPIRPRDTRPLCANEATITPNVAQARRAYSSFALVAGGRVTLNTAGETERLVDTSDLCRSAFMLRVMA